MSSSAKAKDSGNVAISVPAPAHRRGLKARNETASWAIHLGATSQDVLDTALVLQMRNGLALMDESIGRLDAALVKRVREHAETLLSGRNVAASRDPPTTLGPQACRHALQALRRGSRTAIRSACQRAIVFAISEAQLGRSPSAGRFRGLR